MGGRQLWGSLHIRCDNGPEYVSAELEKRAKLSHHRKGPGTCHGMVYVTTPLKKGGLHCFKSCVFRPECCNQSVLLGQFSRLFGDGLILLG